MFPPFLRVSIKTVATYRLLTPFLSLRFFPPTNLTFPRAKVSRVSHSNASKIDRGTPRDVLLSRHDVYIDCVFHKASVDFSGSRWPFPVCFRLGGRSRGSRGSRFSIGPDRRETLAFRIRAARRWNSPRGDANFKRVIVNPWRDFLLEMPRNEASDTVYHPFPPYLGGNLKRLRSIVEVDTTLLSSASGDDRSVSKSFSSDIF